MVKHYNGQGNECSRHSEFEQMAGLEEKMWTLGPVDSEALSGADLTFWQKT